MGNCLTIYTFFELEFEVREECRQGQLAHDFNERFADANSIPSQKRREAVRVSSFAVWSEEVGAFGIEAFWDKFLRLNPLFRVIAQAVHHDDNWIALSNLQFVALDVFRHANRGGVVDWSMHS